MDIVLWVIAVAVAAFWLTKMSICVFLVVLVVTTVWLKNRKRSALPLPPSPPADPILGHLRHIPSVAPEDQFATWSRIYGDVMLLRVFNRNMIILNTAEAAIDLMEKRSWNYSDRPEFPVLEIMGWVPTLTFIGYGKRFQKHRRLLQQYFSKQKVVQYQPIQLREARRLALNLLDNPGEHEAMTRRFSAAIIIRIAYGHEIKSDDDPYIKIVEDTGHAVTHCGPPGSTPVDLFPILQYFPSWFPGTYFAEKAREFNKYIRALHEYPFSQVRKQMVEGTAKPSFLSYHLERLNQEGLETEEEFDDVKGAAAVIYCAGADTTWSNLSIFLLAMTLYPECQARAQAEIDALLDGSRLPDITDHDSLPFIDCIMKETHRWLNAVPSGIPHRTVEDDVYKGMLIPKGSLVFANVRGISMNDAVYHDPSKFKPSRYLPKSQSGQEEPEPLAQFGFGRRICPGRHLADVSLWLAMATILSLYEVKKVRGPDDSLKCLFFKRNRAGLYASLRQRQL
ncbi:hypothetical protein D9756_009969 [Leucocoprinus leucothites]|uniref:Cytochrome P450 n=1 Tax=Leucocoprinus leucothites TaxID=201217 RepID=A0A8H5CV89_9AGAR|nr:hypothetical protein D9756_009969 [Leucoagaricus leucothites]